MKAITRRIERLETASGGDDLDALSDEELGARITALRALLMEVGKGAYVEELEKR